MMDSYKFYTVKNTKGEYFAGQRTWVKKITDARIYGSAAPAKQVITSWAKNFPEYGIPYLVEIKIDARNITVIDQRERLAKSIESYKEREKAAITKTYKNTLEWARKKYERELKELEE